MKKVYRKKILSCVMVFVMILSSVTVSPARVKAEENTGSWTVAVYMCGSDLESSSASATCDLIEMMDAREMPESVNVIIETGGSPKWFFEECVTQYYSELGLPQEYIETLNIPEISSDYIQRYRIQYNNEYTEPNTGETITYATLELLDGKVARNNPEQAEEEEKISTMSQEDTLKEFLTYTQTEFPAEKNMVTLWNHGGGTVGGVCCDYYESKSLSLLELQEVFASASAGLPNKKYDLVSFDACLMSTYETMAAMDSYCRYMVGAITSEPAYGQEHSGYLKELAQQAENPGFTGKELGDAVVEAFHDYYYEEGELIKETGEAEFSILCKEAMLANLDLSKVGESLKVFDDLAEVLLYLEQDEEGMAGMMQEVYATSMIDNQFDLVSLSSFLEKTEIFAQNRAEVLAQSSLKQEKSLGKKYEKYTELANQMYQMLFDSESGVVSSEYKGWENGNKYYSLGVVSLYMPLPQTGKGVSFVDDSYPLLEISENYAIFAYHLANANQDKQSSEWGQKVLWDSESKSYLYTVPEKFIPYLLGVGTQYFLSRDGKYYYVGRDITTPENETYEMSPKTTYFSFNGVPVSVEVHNDVLYKMPCLYNGEKRTLYFCGDTEDDTIWFVYMDNNADVSGDEVYELSPGDVITPMTTEMDSIRYLDAAQRESSLKEDMGAAYTIDEKDIVDEDEYYGVVLPMKEEIADLSEFEFLFYSATTSRIQSFCVNHKDILDFSKASVVLENEEYEMTGKEITPKVTVSSGDKVYEEGKDYMVTYGNNIGTGTGIVTVTGLGQYSCVPEINKTFLISEPKAKIVEKPVVDKQVETKNVTVTKTVYQSLPTAVKITSAKKTKTNITVKYKKKKGTSIGYQIAYATKKGGKKKIAGATIKTTYQIKKVSPKKKYYVYVRAYVKQNGKKFYGAWSSAKKVK